MNVEMKRNVLQGYKDRVERARAEIEETELNLEQYRYEQEIARRLLAKAQDEQARQTWQLQVDVMDMMIIPDEDRQGKAQEDLVLCQAMIAEIEADLAAAQDDVPVAR